MLKCLSLLVLVSLQIWGAAHAAKVPAGRCGELESAPRVKGCGGDAAGSKDCDEKVKRAIAIWESLNSRVAALTGMNTSATFLSADAKTKGGGPFEPSAVICPGSPPIVYVPHSVLDAAPSDDFLAFVLGHELGHRLDDFDSGGNELKGAADDVAGNAREARADARAAYFASVAGAYSVARLGSGTPVLRPEDVVERFLKTHFEYSSARQRETRKASLRAALDAFPAWEGLYQAGMQAALAGAYGAAERLLDWAEERMSQAKVPMPEAYLAHAQVLLLEVARDAKSLTSWSPLGQLDLVCRPVFASHTAYGPEGGLQSGLMGPEDDRREAAKAKVRRAQALLDTAKQLRAAPGLVAATRVCTAFYLGEKDSAQTAQAEAEKALLPGAPREVADAIAANGALVRYLVFSDGKKGPIDPKGLGSVAAKFEAHPALAARLSGHGPKPKPASKANAAADGSTPFQLPVPASMPAGIGVCPAGYSLDWSMPDPAIVQQSGTTYGVTACRKGPADPKLVRVNLAPATSPALDAVDLDLVTYDVGSLPTATRTVADWQQACGGLERGPTSDGGLVAWTGACGARGAPDLLLMATGNGSVRQVVRLRVRE
jgi:hypothetical protein